MSDDDRMTSTIRIGAVPFGVGARLVDGLRGRSDIDLVTDPPARLIEQLRAGQLDAALVSSVEAFRTPGYLALSSLGICSHGPVRSVRAFRRRGTPIRSVGLDAGSETSVALLKLLIQRIEPRAEPRFERIPPTTEPDGLPHDLVLMIGDVGLAADPGQREVIDLGAAWQEWTHLPFVWALWLITPEAPRERVAQELMASHAQGESARIDSGTDGAIYHRLDAAELEGLARFHAESAVVGLSDPEIAPRWIDPTD